MYRILTEEKNVDQVKAELIKLGLDYTVYWGDGCWHGCEEKNMTIELDTATRGIAEKAAMCIKVMNEQEAVLLQEISVVSRLL